MSECGAPRSERVRQITVSAHVEQIASDIVQPATIGVVIAHVTGTILVVSESGVAAGEAEYFEHIVGYR